MRLLQIILVALTSVSSANGQTVNYAQIRFDGLYQTIAEIDKEDKDTSYSFIRFYQDSTIITVGSEGTAQDLKEWFNLKMEGVGIGKYEIKKRRLYFSTTSKTGTVVYKGKISNSHRLKIKWKSLINGNKGKEIYFFVAVNNLK